MIAITVLFCFGAGLGVAGIIVSLAAKRMPQASRGILFTLSVAITLICAVMALCCGYFAV